MIQIDQALQTRYMAQITGLDVVHENGVYQVWGTTAYGNPVVGTYVPTAGRAYATIIVLQNDITPATLKHSNDTDGIFRVLLAYPVNTGAVAAKLKADAIFAAFPIGQRLTYGGVTLTIMSNHRQPGVPESGWYRLALTIGYRATIER